MKWSRIFTLSSVISVVVAQQVQESALDKLANIISAEANLEFGAEDNIDVFPEISYNLDLVKRADNSAIVLTISGLLQSIYASGLITKTLAQLAESTSTLDTVALFAILGINSTMAAYNALGGGLKGIQSILAKSPLNSTELLEELGLSGIVNSTAEGLLFNDTNRDILADTLGEKLATNYWVAVLLNGLASGKDLTWNYLAETIETSTSKANETKKTVIFRRAETPSAANNYLGSAVAFLENIITTVLQSQTFTATLGVSLAALNQSGIVVPLVLDILQDPNLGVILSYVSPKIFESGVLYQIDLSTLFKWAKKKDYLLDGSQVLLTHPVYSPPLGKIFERMETSGVYAQVQANLYGTKKS